MFQTLLSNTSVSPLLFSGTHTHCAFNKLNWKSNKKGTHLLLKILFDERCSNGYLTFTTAEKYIECEIFIEDALLAVNTLLYNNTYTNV